MTAFHMQYPFNLNSTYDYLKITDENNVEGGIYCGQHTRLEIYIRGKQAVITFHSDKFVEETGFKAFFSSAKPCKWNLRLQL